MADPQRHHDRPADPDAARAEALTEAEMKALEERFDPEVRFRPLTPALRWITATALFVLSCYHFYTAGYGIPQATTHRGLHMAFTLGLVFLSFTLWKRDRDPERRSALRPLGLPIYDWILAIAGIVAAVAGQRPGADGVGAARVGAGGRAPGGAAARVPLRGGRKARPHGRQHRDLGASGRRRLARRRRRRPGLRPAVLPGPAERPLHRPRRRRSGGPDVGGRAGRGRVLQLTGCHRRTVRAAQVRVLRGGTAMAPVPVLAAPTGFPHNIRPAGKRPGRHVLPRSLPVGWKAGGLAARASQASLRNRT